MESQLKVLHIDASSGFYKMERFEVGQFFGPVDLGLHLSGKYNSLNVGAGLLAGSIFPGSNRLVFTGFSPCWGTFYISSMGGAALVFDNLGISMFSIRGKAAHPSLLYLNRIHGEEVQVEMKPVYPDKIWNEGRGGVYSVTDTALKIYAERYTEDPRVLAVGPAAQCSDFGAVMSVPIKDSTPTFVDTWAGRGGFGSKMLQEHGIVGIIYGGTYIDEDFRDRKVANEWFEKKYQKKMAAKDMEATTKYRLDPALNTGGTFGVNYAKMGGKLLAFNYSSIYDDETNRLLMQKEFIEDHYLRQFNEDLHSVKKNKSMKNCGEPCVAMCKKMHGEYKKDYEPYQTMGPLCGVFDQRAAENINHTADTLGFDGISIGGVLSWLMECVDKNFIGPDELGIKETPIFSAKNFSIQTDSHHNSRIGIQLMKNMVTGRIDMTQGPRILAHKIAAQKNNKKIIDLFVFSANARKGWMVPNQYWTPGVLSPMPIMGKYYMYYGAEFHEPRQLGRVNAQRMQKELILDNAGFCRFHRAWAEDMVPHVIGELFNCENAFVNSAFVTARNINSRNSAVFWESERNMDFVMTSLERMHNVDGNNSPELMRWIDLFKKDKKEASLEFWFEIQKGIYESFM